MKEKSTDREYVDGWEGLTKTKWKRMNSSSNSPVWCICTGGANVFLAGATLRANGLHPDKIPEIFKNNKSTLGEILRKVSETIPLTFVPTPE